MLTLMLTLDVNGAIEINVIVSSVNACVSVILDLLFAVLFYVRSLFLSLLKIESISFIKLYWSVTHFSERNG